MSNENNNEKAIAALANIPCLFWLPWVAAKGSEFAMFYLNQGFWYLILTVVAQVISIFGVIGDIIGWVIQVVVLVFVIIGIVGATKYEQKACPVLGNIIIFK